MKSDKKEEHVIIEKVWESFKDSEGETQNVLIHPELSRYIRRLERKIKELEK